MSDERITPKPAALLLVKRGEDHVRVQVYDNHLDAWEVAKRYRATGAYQQVSMVDYEYFANGHLPDDLPAKQERMF